MCPDAGSVPLLMGIRKGSLGLKTGKILTAAPRAAPKKAYADDMSSQPDLFFDWAP